MTRLSTPILGSGSSRLMQDDASKYREVYGRINEIVLLSLAVFPVFHRVFYETRYMTRVHTLSMNYLIIEGYISSLSHPLSLPRTLALILARSLFLSFFRVNSSERRSKKNTVTQMPTLRSIWRTKGSFDFTSCTIFTVSSSSSTSNGISGSLG